MLRTVVWTLRQRRYVAIAAGTFAIALGCIAAGTWQIQRFDQSVHDNDALKRNAHAASTPLTTALAPLSGTAKAPGRDAIRYRTVSVTGTYLDDISFVGGKIISDTGGFYIVSSLRTANGILPVVRGFVAADSAGNPPPVAAAPRGQVRLTGRLDTLSSDEVGRAAAESAALGVPRYLAVLNLVPGQRGGENLVALPAPDLSNPAGGAYEAQHFAYIVQWYAFALIALAAPFLLARNEVREAQRQFLGYDEGAQELTSGAPLAAIAGAGSSGAELAVRADGTVAHLNQYDTAELARAKRLADRYGRALSMGTDVPAKTAAPSRRRKPTPVGGLTERVPDSSVAPHRSHDSYQGAYNDYLWELGLADGEIDNDT